MATNNSKSESSSKSQVLYKQEPSDRPRRNISATQRKRQEEALRRSTQTSTLMKWKHSDSGFKRGLYKIINGVWVGVVAVGSFIAWLISFFLV